MSKVIEEIRNPPEGGAITITESGRQAILYWKRLAEKAADELESKNKEIERLEVVVEAADELRMLVEDARKGDYDIDSFTVQPLDIALSNLKEAKGEK